MAALPASRDFAAEMRGASPSAVEPEQVGADERKPKVKINFHKVFDDEDTRDEPPEMFLMDTLAMRPRSMSHHLSSTQVPSRRWLHLKAKFWRTLMGMGMPLHGFAKPYAPRHAFVRRISTDTTPIELYFYVPHDYKDRARSAPDHRYPLVVNFHGGGFCLGHATDDRYWARVIIKSTPAVFVSVGYRRAPEHPFPQPVDDCVEALLYLQAHAEELRIDPSQIALSGFSAGANLAFTVPFRLTYQYEKHSSSEHLPLAPQRKHDSNLAPSPLSPSNEQMPTAIPSENRPLINTENSNNAPSYTSKPTTTSKPSGFMTLNQPNPGSAWSSAADLRRVDTSNSNSTPLDSRTNLLNLPGPRSKLLRTKTQESHFSSRNANSANDHPVIDRLLPPEPQRSKQIRIVSILAWYPLLDWTASRSEKKRGSRMPKKTLPAVFTDLFDFSYLPAPDREGHHCSPYASPALAPDHMIMDGLPQRIQMWLCEWDMLLHEGELFRDRLQELGKDVDSETIPNVPHGWDKSPNPFRDQASINILYERAAGYLREVFGAADRRATIGEGIGLGGLR